MAFLSRIYNLTVNSVVDSFVGVFHKEQKQPIKKVLLCKLLPISVESVTLLSTFFFFFTEIAGKFTILKNGKEQLFFSY